MVPSPTFPHQNTEMELSLSVGWFVKRHALGVVLSAPMDVALSDTDVVQPDLLFVSRERAHIIAHDAIRGAPDLVVEILSPSTARRDLTFKRRLYAQAWRQRVLAGEHRRAAGNRAVAGQWRL